jgi:general secretion pathway protein E
MSATTYMAEVFRRRAAVAPEALSEAVAQAERDGDADLLDVLVRGGADEHPLAAALAAEAGVDFTRALPTTPELPIALLKEVDYDFGFARQRQIIPVRELDGGALVVAMANPLDTFALDDLRLLFDRALSVVAASPSLVLDAINRAQAEINRASELQAGEQGGQEERADILESDEDAPSSAGSTRSSSRPSKSARATFTSSPTRAQVVVRYRIDGSSTPCARRPSRCSPASSRA